MSSSLNIPLVIRPGFSLGPYTEVYVQFLQKEWIRQTHSQWHSKYLVSYLLFSFAEHRIVTMIRDLVLFTLTILFSFCESYDILFVHNMGTRSHLITLKPIVEELLRRNHSVTSIFFQSIDVSHENYTEILLPPQPTSVFAMAAQKKLVEKVSPASPGIQICKKCKV